MLETAQEGQGPGPRGLREGRGQGKPGPLGLRAEGAVAGVWVSPAADSPLPFVPTPQVALTLWAARAWQEALETPLHCISEHSPETPLLGTCDHLDMCAWQQQWTA